MSNIAIFAPWGKGDLCNSTGVLRYREELWPNSKVIWYCYESNMDLLSFNNSVDEIRKWEKSMIKCRGKNGELKHSQRFPSLSDIDKAYYTTPWMNLNILDAYKNCSFVVLPRIIFGLNDKPWRPCLFFSEEEDAYARRFIDDLPSGKRIMLETKFNSGQSQWNDDLTLKVIRCFNEKFGKCNFIMASKDQPRIPGTFSCSSLTVRQCIPLYNYMDFFVGVSSGISCATCAWTASRKVRRIEFCNNVREGTLDSITCNTKEALFRAIKEA